MNILKHKGLKETAFRKDVLNVFTKHKNAIAPTVIEKALKNFDRTTLYRTLKVFVDKGVIHEISLGSNQTNYALCQHNCSEEEHQHQHIHFKCEKCSKVYCVEVEKLPAIQLKGYQINQLEIQATGTCVNCN